MMRCSGPVAWLAALAMVGPGPSIAQEAPKPVVAATKLDPTPWHLVDLWWDLGRAEPFESYSVEVTIGDEVPAASRLYIAPIGLGHLGTTPFYGGIQTQIDGNTRKDPRLRTLGPGFLFSMWEERSLDAIRAADGGFLQSSGHEGDFVSVRRPYAWRKGTYTYQLVRMDREVVAGRPYTWVGAFVRSHELDENLFVGALRFPGDAPVLAAQVASFVEVYGPTIPVEEIPRATVTFGPLKVNGKAVAPRKVEAIYPRGVPDRAEAGVRDGRVVVEVGKLIEGRVERTVRLIPGG